MDWDQRCVRFCAAMLVCTVLLRLAGLGAFAPVIRVLQSREALSFFLYLQTGRHVRLSAPEPVTPEAEPPPPQTEPPALTFSAAEAELLELPELENAPALLTSPLDWDLTGPEPTVLILHTHTTESYTPTHGDDYKESSPYRTLDSDYNMLCLGALVARRLEEAGIRCIHDTALHDYPSYTGSYSHAGASTADILAQYPTVQLVLDLHRDAADTAYGQMVTECFIGSQTSAQLMFVVGTDHRLDHPGWERNLSLALKLTALLERQSPGICRKLNLSDNRYNQHLGPYALLVEIGAAGNTLPEATLAAEKLAQAIIALRHGSS